MKNEIIIIIGVIVVFMGLMINSSIQNKKVTCNNEINKLNAELQEINVLTKNMLEPEKLKTTSENYAKMKKTGIEICQGNELLFYGTGYDLTEQQYKTICYTQNNLKFKYFSLNSLLEI